MKKIKTTGNPFDVILLGVPVATVTTDYQVFEEGMANLIISAYSHTIAVEDVTPEENFSLEGEVDNTKDNGN